MHRPAADIASRIQRTGPRKPSHVATGNVMFSRLCTLLVLLLSALCWTESVAVELEPIQLRSRIGEPLLAEIRVRDAPADLQALSVGLPDPVVFARIGLPRPRGVVADMRFSVRRG